VGQWQDSPVRASGDSPTAETANQPRGTSGTRLIDQIATLIANTPCPHCGQTPGAAPSPPPERVDDGERELWRLVAAGERITADAPPAVPAEKLAKARSAVTSVGAVLDTVNGRITAIEEALGTPLSWLLPSRRFTLAAQLRRDHDHRTLAREQVSAAQEHLTRLDIAEARRLAYLTKHRAALDAARKARAELDRHIDELIHGYARQAAPPWFRYGLGYPPAREDYASWLRRARAAIAYRRRFGVHHPLEPLGPEPSPGTTEHREWKAARGA